jgi:hypothetical protein
MEPEELDHDPDPIPERRLKYYGPHDLASRFQIDEALDVIRKFDGGKLPLGLVDHIELFNAHRFVEDGFLPASLSDSERSGLGAAGSHARSAVARFFTGVVPGNVDELVRDVPFEYHSDLLALLGNNRAYERCDAEQMIGALTSCGVNLAEMLGNKKLVEAYDFQLKAALLEHSRGAEHVIRRHFARDHRDEIYLPRSLTPVESRDLIARYVASPDPNMNYLGLVETAPISGVTGVDARLKLAAKRRKDQETEAFFRENEGMTAGSGVIIADGQSEPVIMSVDGMVIDFSYSRDWLDASSDNPSILNNFQHLFEFTNRDVLLTLPAYRAELGVLERFLITTGQTDYVVGAAYRVRDMSSTLQTQMLQTYLAGRGIELEAVIAWFFEEYLPAEFEAHGFRFNPSAGGSTYLEKARHLFVEMESVVRQFALFVEDGEIDRELLAIMSDPVGYKQVPSLLSNKYLYATKSPEIVGILHALFSDQSSIHYISDQLRGDNAVTLLIENDVRYDDFETYQKPAIDHLIALGVLRNDGARVQIASRFHLRILQSLFAYEAVSYHHLPAAAKQLADEMVARGWLRSSSSLLTTAEGSYYNFHLNKAEFSNGPELRNRYLHGSQADADGERAHLAAYLSALKLTVALVLKINDEFALRAGQGSTAPAPGTTPVALPGTLDIAGEGADGEQA